MYKRAFFNYTYIPTVEFVSQFGTLYNIAKEPRMYLDFLQHSQNKLTSTLNVQSVVQPN